MRKDKHLAIKLRKQGNSYGQINTSLGIPKSTLSCWLKNIKISKKAKIKISNRVNNTSIKALIKRNKEQVVVANERARIIREESRLQVKKLMSDKLFVAGIGLYWAEGYKKGAYGSKWKCVDFTNSDSEMILLMIKFFKKICKVNSEKIKIQLIAHINIDINKAVKFWSNITKIPSNQFIKSSASLNKNSHGKRKNTLINGTVHIRIYDVKLFFKIIGWIDGYKEYFNINRGVA